MYVFRFERKFYPFVFLSRNIFFFFGFAESESIKFFLNKTLSFETTSESSNFT